MEETARDPKIVIIAILVLALIVVGGLYINEVRKPDSLAAFESSLKVHQQEIEESCVNLATAENRAGCAETLKDLQGVLEAFQGTSSPSTN